MLVSSQPLPARRMTILVQPSNGSQDTGDHARADSDRDTGQLRLTLTLFGSSSRLVIRFRNPVFEIVTPIQRLLLIRRYARNQHRSPCRSSDILSTVAFLTAFGESPRVHPWLPWLQVQHNNQVDYSILRRLPGASGSPCMRRR